MLNRPYAFVQWLQGSAITEKYVFMSEPDHIWLKPMPNLMVGQRPASFPFFYIEPSKTEFLPITQKFTGPLSRKQAEQIAPIGIGPHCTVQLLMFLASLVTHKSVEHTPPPFGPD